MHIGAPHAEGTDSGATRRRAGGPGFGLGIDVEGTGGEIDLRIGRIEVQAGRQAAVLERHHGLDQTGNAGGDIEVPDIGFNRADRAVTTALAVAALKRLAQGGDLDGIAQRGAGAVRLDIADGLRRDLGHGLGGENDRRLSLDAGRGVTHLGRAVVVHRRAFDHRVDRVARGERLGQALERHHADAAADGRAGRARIEGPAVAIRRQNGAGLIAVAAALQQIEPDAAGQGQIEFVVEQPPAGQVHRGQGCGTGRLHRDGGAAQIELIRHAGGQKVLAIAV